MGGLRRKKIGSRDLWKWSSRGDCRGDSRQPREISNQARHHAVMFVSSHLQLLGNRCREGGGLMSPR